MTYAEKLKTPQWQKRRLSILERDKWKCTFCKDSESTLHVHHKSYGNDPLLVPDSELVTVCKDCHWLIETIKEYYNVIRIDKLYSTSGVLNMVAFCKGFDNNFCICIGKLQEDNFEYVITLGQKTVDDMFEILKEIIKNNG